MKNKMPEEELHEYNAARIAALEAEVARLLHELNHASAEKVRLQKQNDELRCMLRARVKAKDPVFQLPIKE